VAVVRDFIEAHRKLRRVFERHRSGELRFAELRDLVGDDDRSVLFRLKERCHALFRDDDGGSSEMRREALFDLAVGSLFHEAMKFRENFYQRDVYGPRVRALRQKAARQADGLFGEFERILGAVKVRLEEGLEESETLLGQTRDQLLELLRERDDDGLLARYLLENAAAAEEAFGKPNDELLSDIYGDPARAHATAARSYLLSGYFEDAERELGRALERGGDASRLGPLLAYARGMAAYLAGDYPETVRRLSEWVDAGVDVGVPGDGAVLADVAASAVSRIDRLVDPESRAELVKDAAALLERLPAAAPA